MFQTAPQEVYIVGQDALQGPFYSLAQAKQLIDMDLMEGPHAFAIVPPFGDKHQIIEATRKDLHIPRPYHHMRLENRHLYE